MPLPEFNDMTLRQIHKRDKELSRQARQFGEIEATLMVNCRPGHALHDRGIVYDESKSVLWNLLHILKTLTATSSQSKDKS